MLSYKIIHKKNRRLEWLKMENCKFCGKQFEAKRSWQKFCCTEHRKAYHRIYPNIEKRIEDLEKRIEALENKS